MRGTFEEPPTGLIPWFSKTEGNTYATIVASPFHLQGKPTQAQDVATGDQRHGEEDRGDQIAPEPYLLSREWT